MFLEHYHDPQTVERFFRHFGILQREPTLEFLSELSLAFSRIPYENITKIIKANNFGGLDRLRLPHEVLEDYFRYGTGGTCFSLTFFFHTICRESGFISYPIMANRSYGKNTHCALVVLIDSEKFLVDPGFLIQRPIPLRGAQGLIFPTSFNTIYLVHDFIKSTYDFYTIHQGIRKWRCRFREKMVSWNHFQQHWEASFNWQGMNSIVVTVLDKGKQIYFHNTHLRVVGTDKVIKEKIREADLHLLHSHFNINQEIIQKALDIVL